MSSSSSMTNYPISEEIYIGKQRKSPEGSPERNPMAPPEKSRKSRSEKKEKERLAEALKLNEPLSCAYYLKEDLRQIWLQPNKENAERVFTDWIKRAQTTGIKMLKKFANTLGRIQIRNPCLLRLPHLIRTPGRHKQQNQNHETNGLRIQRYGILQTQNHGPS